MSRALKPATRADLWLVATATRHLREARRMLVIAGCPKSAAKVRSALKSAEGALRHVGRRAAATPDPARRRPQDDEAFEALDQDAP